jgi:hypothetical protein
MRKKAIKAVLFSLSSLAAFSAQASNLPDGLHFVEELPVEQRVVLHKAVMKYFNQNPAVAAEANIIAIDERGTVYVLDHKMAILANVGEPSCGG